MKISKLKFYLFLLILVSMSIFYISNQYLGGYLGSIEKTGKELWSKPDSLYQWQISDQAPYKYRVLFPWVINSSWRLLFSDADNNSFYLTYKTWSLLFFIASVLSFYFLLRRLHFSLYFSLAGALIFLSSPPMLMAYSLPVHTREDTLAYTLLSLGMLYTIQKKSTLVLLLSILGVLCRETLLILPFMILFFSALPFFSRLIIALTSASVIFGIRIYMGFESYPVLEKSFLYNLENIGQSIAFIFITFGWLWIIFFDALISKHLIKINTYNALRQMILRSAPWAFLLIFGSTFLGGRFNEIRLLFLFFPWIISIALWWLSEKKEILKKLIGSKQFVVYCFVCVCISLVFCLFSLKTWPLLFDNLQYNIPVEVWIVLFFINILFVLLLLPVFGLLAKFIHR